MTCGTRTFRWSIGWMSAASAAVGLALRQDRAVAPTRNTPVLYKSRS